MSQVPPSGDSGSDLEKLERRMDLLERENQRLREKVEPLFGPDNPCFDTRIFTRVLQRTQLAVIVPVMLLSVLPPLLMNVRTYRPMLVGWRIGPVPVIDLGGSTSGVHGIGLGIIAYGGASLGVVALGGLGVGVIAIGGGAVGVVAIGGGAMGVFALGGGACGYIAIGGGAVGYYTLAYRAHGKFALGLNRQDQQAIDLFMRWIPGLRSAVTTAMPVILLPRPDPGADASTPENSSH